MWKLSSRAFQWCITLYSRKWTVWPWEAIFSKKLPEKQLFWVSRFRINWLWAAITPVQNLQISKTTTFSESSGRQLSHELLGRSLASILSDRRPVENFYQRDTKKCQKMFFFAFGQITRVFELVWPIQAGTMWRLTSWGFRKCGGFRDLEVLNHSYRLSKSGQIQKKKIGVAKKRHGHNNDSFSLIRNQRVPIRGGYTLIQWQRSELIIVAVSFFWNASYFW